MWVFFEYEAPEGGVLDVRRLNDNFIQVMQLQGGGLGEHNLAEGLVTSHTQVATDVALRHIDRMRDVEPLPGNKLEVPRSIAWRPVDPGGVFFERSFQTRGGQFYVEISFSFSSDVSGVDLDPGLNFGIALDGVVQNDTVIGSGDLGGDDLRLSATGGIGIDRTGGSTYYSGEGSYGPAVRMLNGALTLTWVGYVSKGYHNIGLVYRNPTPASDEGSQGVINGEIHILELWS